MVTGRGGQVLNSGTAECPLRNVVRDLGYAISISEQVESELNVMIDFTHDPAAPVSLCQGMLLRALPDCDLTRFERIRNRLHESEARKQLARSGGADGLFEDVLNPLLAPEETDTRLEVHPGPSPTWFCTCREEKIHTTLRILPPEDRQELTALGEPIVVRCDFCNRAFRFTVKEAQSIWADSGSDA